MYYAIQVVSRSEKSTIKSILERVPHDLFNECFFPTREMNRKMKGIWSIVPETIFPGYIFIDSDRINDLSAALIRIPEFARVLGKDSIAGSYIPLSDAECRIIDTLCGRETNYTAKISNVEIQEGKIAHIISGALMGFEGKIIKVNLHRRQVTISIDLLGRKNDVVLGINFIDLRN